MKMLYCGKCFKLKSSNQFHKNRRRKNRHEYWCKDCRCAYQRERYQRMKSLKTT